MAIIKMLFTAPSTDPSSRREHWMLLKTETKGFLGQGLPKVISALTPLSGSLRLGRFKQTQVNWLRFSLSVYILIFVPYKDVQRRKN